MVIETSTPPEPVPLTVACIPTIFVPPGQGRKHTFALAPYGSGRVRDPCPHLSWGRMRTPTNSQMVDVISVLMELVNIKKVHFFPASIVVEIVYGDGRVYKRKSLPALMAGLVITYHHDSVSFFEPMKDHIRERLLDPAQHLPGSNIPQDGTNYLREPSWRILNPGVRVSTGAVTGSGTYANAVQSTCGILLRKGIAQPTPAYFSNQTYFQAEPPKRLVDTSNLVVGTWFEVDGMSTGMLSFQYLINSWECPVQPPGHPQIPVLKWKRDITFRIFGASSPQLMDGLCGAPFVEVETGNVAGFFHLANGDWAECATLDDVVAEGWDVA
jgi:hypothetical protein